jgi:uncharacterized protein (TIGR02118 family)
MLKVCIFIEKLEGISREEFLHYWCNEHPEYVLRLPGVRRYVQNPAIEHKTQWPADGMAELWFDNLRDVAKAFDGKEAEELRKHEEHFIGKMTWFIANEILVFEGEGDAS